MKGYSIFIKNPGLEPHHQIVWCPIQDTRWVEGSNPSAGMQPVYSTAIADWAQIIYDIVLILCTLILLMILATGFSWYISKGVGGTFQKGLWGMFQMGLGGERFKRGWGNVSKGVRGERFKEVSGERLKRGWGDVSKGVRGNVSKGIRENVSSHHIIFQMTFSSCQTFVPLWIPLLGHISQVDYGNNL